MLIISGFKSGPQKLETTFAYTKFIIESCISVSLNKQDRIVSKKKSSRQSHSQCWHVLFFTTCLMWPGSLAASTAWLKVIRVLQYA